MIQKGVHTDVKCLPVFFVCFGNLVFRDRPTAHIAVRSSDIPGDSCIIGGQFSAWEVYLCGRNIRKLGVIPPKGNLFGSDGYESVFVFQYIFPIRIGGCFEYADSHSVNRLCAVIVQKSCLNIGLIANIEVPEFAPDLCRIIVQLGKPNGVSVNFNGCVFKIFTEFGRGNITATKP